ncbi:MAG: hypothetical protein QXS68_03055 [Candidatus Methanomethylicaceae archaeon]
MSTAEVVVCVLDPGVTTGFVVMRGVLDLDEKDIVYDVLERAELLWPESALRPLQVDADFWVVEDFILRSEKAKGVSARDPLLITVRIIGALQIMLPPEKLVLQRNVDKAVCPDENLKKLKLWDSSPHIRDAIRHGVIFLNKWMINTLKSTS